MFRAHYGPELLGKVVSFTYENEQIYHLVYLLCPRLHFLKVHVGFGDCLTRLVRSLGSFNRPH